MPESKKNGFRVFPRSFKVAAVLRMEGCENVSALARELGVRRKLLYEWRDGLRAEGEAGLRSRGRPRKGSGPGSGSAGDLAAAQHRIAELERKVGQQALEADFLRQALQLLETSRRPDDRRGGTASTASSRSGRGGKAD